MIKFSKSYKNIHKIKQNYFDFNYEELTQIKKINKIYAKQKIRKNCKICSSKLKKSLMVSFGIPYIFCNNCNHLNGRYEDSKKFHEHLYSGKKNLNFGKLYLKNYNEIVKNIHHPKVKFLKQIIKKKINILDYGSGAGHFVKACLDQKINARGIEKNLQLHKFAKNKIYERALLEKEVNLEEIIEDYKIDCMSLIFVLEHLPDPHKIFKLFKKSRLKYLYISVPMASFSIFIENVFPRVYPRQLGGSHTHLFTKESLMYLKKKYKFKIIGEWWFGTDIVDLYRNIVVTNNILNPSNKNIFKKKFDNVFFDSIEKLQSIIDKKKLSSELHFIIKK